MTCRFDTRDSKVVSVLCGLIGLLLLPACSNDLPSRPGLPYADEGPLLTADQLAVPAGFQVAEVGDTFLELAWADTSGTPPAIVVQGRGKNKAGFSLWTILAAGIDSWDAPVDPDSTYVIRIAARNADGHSPWTEPVTATSWPLHFWDVTGGISNLSPGYRDVFFEFGRANRFRPLGTLTVNGPPGWNPGRTFSQSWATYYIGFRGRGVATGDYELEFHNADRLFLATVAINAALVLPIPEVDHEFLDETHLAVSWSCPGASTFSLAWGPPNDAAWGSVGAGRDTVLTVLPEEPEYWLGVAAYTEDLEGQPARSEWQHTFLIEKRAD